MRFQADCYRIHDPRWSFAPLSGDGATLHGGRFNPAGMPALYLASSPEGALAEASQGFVTKLQPLTLCLYEVDCNDVVDLRDEAGRAGESTPLDTLACPWRLAVAEGREPPSWTLARRLYSRGCSGILAPSFAPAATDRSFNPVLWRWGPGLPHRVDVHDPDGRLPRDQRSWNDE